MRAGIDCKALLGTQGIAVPKQADEKAGIVLAVPESDILLSASRTTLLPDVALVERGFDTIVACQDRCSL